MISYYRFAIFIFILNFSGLLYAQTPLVKKELEWYQKGYFILNPAISNTSNEIGFACLLSGKDSNITNSSFDKVGIDRTAVNNTIASRPYDPLLCVLNTKNHNGRIIDYGWSPAFSPNGKDLVYVFQQTLLRKQDKLVASSYVGNGLKYFQYASSKYRTILSPGNGYLLDPFFIDSAQILYKTGERVNGPYGAGVSFGSVDLSSGKTKILYQPIITYRLYDLMGSAIWLNGKLAFTVYSPADTSSENTWNYFHLLMSGKDTLQNFGIKKYKNLKYKLASNKNGELVFLNDNIVFDDDTSFLETYREQKLVEKKPLNMKFKKAWISPDASYLVYVNSLNEIFIMSIYNFNTTRINLPNLEIHNIAWNDNGKKLIIIQDHAKLPSTEVLYLYTIN